MLPSPKINYWGVATMRVSELRAKLAEIERAHGDVGVYGGNMDTPTVEYRETYVDEEECPEERLLYGDGYVFIEL